MAYVDENGEEHCCEDCAKAKHRSPMPWGALFASAVAAAATSGVVLALTRSRPAEKREDRG